jgi:hypothetical protein
LQHRGEDTTDETLASYRNLSEKQEEYLERIAEFEEFLAEANAPDVDMTEVLNELFTEPT